jgi:hypothetical protein
MIFGDKVMFEFREDVPMDKNVVDDMISNLTNISSVYHKFAKEMIKTEDLVALEGDGENENDNDNENDDNAKVSTKVPTKENDKPVKIHQQQINRHDAELIGIEDLLGNHPSPTNNTSQNTVNFDIFDMNLFNNSNANNLNIEFRDESPYIDLFSSKDSSSMSMDTNLSLTPMTNGLINKNIGLCIYSSFTRNDGKVILGIRIKNYTNDDLNQFEIKFNQNAFGLIIVDNPDFKILVLKSKQSLDFKFDIDINSSNSNKTAPSCPFRVECLVKNNLDTWSFTCPLLLHILLSEIGQMDNSNFVQFYQKNNNNPYNSKISINTELSEESIISSLRKNNIFIVAKNTKLDPPATYFSCSVANVMNIILETTFQKDITSIVDNRLLLNVKIISSAEPLVSLIKESLNLIIR